MPDQMLVLPLSPASCCLFVLLSHSLTQPIATVRIVSPATVQGGERAVMFNRIVGVKQFVYEEGTHFKLPWFDIPTIFDIRTRPTTIKSLTGSKGSPSPPCLPPSQPTSHNNPAPSPLCPQICRWLS